MSASIGQPFPMPDPRSPIPAIFRAAYRDIPVYAPHEATEAPPVTLDVSDNTNLWGPPPAALAALRDVGGETVSRYPSLYAHELKAPLARYAGVPADAIVTGCGSDDVIDSTMRAFCEPGDRVAFPVPTFGMIPTFAKMNALVPVGVPLLGPEGAWDVDVEALLATNARIIYLCSPNNPTGTIVSPEAIRAIVERAPGLVVLDEAYAEFAGGATRAGAEAVARPNVVVMRTMSKAFGLAGLRVGYGIGAPTLVREIEKARGPYMLNAAALRAATAALSAEGAAWVAQHACEAVGERIWLDARLRALGLAPLPSRANFVLVPVPDAMAIARPLRARGILVRAFTALPGIGDALRLGVGPRPAMESLVAALDEVRRALPDERRGA